MIGIQNISLSFGQQIIFNNITFSLLPNQKIGVVGRNGAGKSTLLKIIAGLQALDEGSVSIDKNKTIAYLPQELVIQSTKTIIDEALSTFAELIAQKAELEQLEHLMHAQTTIDQQSLERYAYLQEHFCHTTYSNVQMETNNTLRGLGFKEKDFNKPVASLSQGWRMRLILAKLLLQKADFYLFDEPTNHLDIVAKDWFLDFLKNANTGFLLVTHDRFFLDHACNQILEIEFGRVTFYRGNYTTYCTQKEQRLEVLQKTYEEQQRDIKRKTKTIERFRAKANKASMAQSMIKKLEKIERIELPPSIKDIDITLPPVQQPGKVVLTVKHVSKTFDQTCIFKDVQFEINRGEKVAIVAANGTGKSTLFNLIAGRYPLETGSIKLGHNATMALFEQDQNKALHPDNTVLQEVEESCTDSATRALVRGLLGAFLFPGDDVKKRISVLSGGEKNRVAMVKVLLTHANFLLLDEPTNHLDLQSKDILLTALKNFTGTLLFVSHDRTFLDNLATRILELSPNGIVSYPGNYESYLYQRAQREKSLTQSTTSPACTSQRQSDAPITHHKAATAANGREAYEQRKKLASIERSIEKLEAKIIELSNKLEAAPSGSATVDQIYQELQAAQQQLDKKMKEWDAFDA